jgi:hypothetical protein
VSHSGLAIYTKKYFKVKQELWKFKYFTKQKYNIQKQSSKRNQNLSRYRDSIVTGKEVTKQLVFDGLYSVNAKFILRV